MFEMYLTESEPQHYEVGTKFHANVVNEDITHREYK